MEEKKNLLTYAGLKALEDELHDLKVNRRKEVAGKIKEAREQGDLSENAEYDAAKDEQRDIEARIEEIEKILKNAEVVVEDEVDLDKISVGCQVRILDCEFDEELEYKIVGSTEANSLKGKISNESPVGKALLGGTGGFFVMHTSGQGDLLINAYGDIMEINVDADHPITIDNEHVIAWDDSLDYEIKIASGTFGFTTGEGLVNEFHGNGKVYIQSRNLHSLADALIPFIPQGKD